MKRVVRIVGQGRGKDVGLRGLATVPAAGGVDSTVALIQALIPLGLKAVGEALAGEGSRRSGGCPGAVRWCRQRGAVSLRDQQLPIPSQRVRDRLRNTEIPLPTSQQLQTPRQADAGLFRRVLLGLSCRAYAACAEAVPAAFGPSPSTISRRFIRASATTLREFCERRLDAFDFVALVLDGETCAEDALVLALGITLTGEQVILGLGQTATENGAVCAAFLRELVERGLR